MIRRSTTTLEEFEALASNLGPCELVRGEVCQLSPGGFFHSSISVNISRELANWARQARKGRVLSNEAGLVVASDPGTVRGADIAYLSYERLSKGQRFSGFLSMPPELVVEIIGKGQGWADMVEKAGEYLRMGVNRVWIVDPDTCRVRVYRSDQEPVVFSEGATISDPEILPGFSCRIEEFFED